MHQDRESFWADIKSYEERLAKNPESFLFARLSEVYLKVQLVDDALHIARQGVARYPAYISGQRALAMACYAKGLHGECLQALQKIAAASPEDVEVQKLLGKLLADAGDYSGAKKAFCTVLEFRPDDSDSLMEVEKLEQVSVGLPTDAGFGFGPLVDEVEEEIIQLTDSDIVEEEQAVLAPVHEAAAVPVTRHDPLTTATLAELYVQQGFADKALDIYRSIYADNPDDSAVKIRIAELEASLSELPASGHVAAEPVSAFDEPFSAKVTDSLKVTTDNFVAVMESWLDNIRRLRLCR